MTLTLDETDLEMRADSHLGAESPLLLFPEGVGALLDVDAWLEVFWLWVPMFEFDGLIEGFVDGAAAPAASLCCCCCCLNSLIPCKIFG